LEVSFGKVGEFVFESVKDIINFLNWVCVSGSFFLSFLIFSTECITASYIDFHFLGGNHSALNLNDCSLVVLRVNKIVGIRNNLDFFVSELVVDSHWASTIDLIINYRPVYQ
jgi:hypothetical protein